MSVGGADPEVQTLPDDVLDLGVQVFADAGARGNVLGYSLAPEIGVG